MGQTAMESTAARQRRKPSVRLPEIEEVQQAGQDVAGDEDEQRKQSDSDERTAQVLDHEVVDGHLGPV